MTNPNNMNKAELARKIASKTGFQKKTCETLISSFLETVKETLQEGGRVSLVGFGTFYLAKRAKTVGINPKTREKIDIPAKNVPRLKFSDNINNALNQVPVSEE